MRVAGAGKKVGAALGGAVAGAALLLVALAGAAVLLVALAGAAVLLFYHTLCLIHASKHFTNCTLHELFHFHTTQFWVTLLYTLVVDL